TAPPPRSPRSGTGTRQTPIELAATGQDDTSASRFKSASFLLPQTIVRGSSSSGWSVGLGGVQGVGFRLVTRGATAPWAGVWWRGGPLPHRYSGRCGQPLARATGRDQSAGHPRVPRLAFSDYRVQPPQQRRGAVRAGLPGGQPIGLPFSQVGELGAQDLVVG